jgi:hypothetical protein
MIKRPPVRRPLAALLCIIVGALTCIGGLAAGLTPTAAQGQATPTPEATVQPSPTPATRVEGCADCHLDVVANWQTSTHAGAYQNTAFQSAWMTANRDMTCLRCHTTGFNPRTGAYQHEGITCEACHGQTPGTHPPETFVVDKRVEICAGCHVTTVSEWERSAHGEQQLACTSCHLPHPQQLRFASTAELCLTCHKEQPAGYVHVTHAEKSQCVDCHWHRGTVETQQAHLKTGDQFYTGHDNNVITRTCLDCHERLTAEGQPVISQPQPTLVGAVETLARVGELETRIQSMQAQAENNALLRIAEGLALGAVLGGAATFLVASFVYRPQRKPGARSEGNERTDHTGE